MLMSASDDPIKDREIFLKILTMDEDGTWQPQKGEIPIKTWREVAPAEIQDKYFGTRGFQSGIIEEKKRFVLAEIGDGLSDDQQEELDKKKQRSIASRSDFDELSYPQHLVHCVRPENISGPSREAWIDMNSHLGTTASALPYLVDELSHRRLGHTPRVGDAVCGGGSIPFEAARIRCEAFGSDLNPVTGLPTSSSINLAGTTKRVKEVIIIHSPRRCFCRSRPSDC
jgi:hypothetical protein